MTRPPSLALALVGLLVSLAASGCLNLKPVEDPVRYFLLTPVESPSSPEAAPREGIALGLERVTVPAYLSRPWMVVRTGPTEIRYSDYHKWGEHLDQGIQRVLGENLARRLDTARLHLGTWRKEAVDVELSVSIQQFDVDAQGQVVLEAQWRIQGARTAAGQAVIRKRGPAPDADPGGAAAAMSEALGELSRILASELQP
ncbi:MAG: PqiC family protein [Verrucomicrobia bacterium]|jgi:hypothetical protein|nr:PqiC family protein [Verrucomicrobiota bacterium]